MSTNTISFVKAKSSAMLTAAVVCSLAGQALADGWYAKAPAWSRSVANAAAIGAANSDDSGVTFGQSSAFAVAVGMAGSRGSSDVATRGLWGGTISLTARKGGSAGGMNPFGEVDSPVGETGMVELDWDAEMIGGSTLRISGMTSFDDNGFFEIGVVDRSVFGGDVSDVFSTHGSFSVGSASDPMIANSLRALFRESSFISGQSFQLDVDVSGLAFDDITVFGLGHSISAVPTPGALGLAACSGLVATRRRRR